MGSEFSNLDPTALIRITTFTTGLLSCTRNCAKDVCSKQHRWRPWAYTQCWLEQIGRGSSCRETCFLPKPGEFPDPDVQSWRPNGPRDAYPENVIDYSIVPLADQMHTMHTNDINSDNILNAAAVNFELDWVAE